MPRDNTREFDGRRAPPLRTPSERKRRSRIVELEITMDLVNFWKKPKYQREVKDNHKVDVIAEELKSSGQFDTIIVIGVLNNELYKVDGNHRLYCFEKSELDSVIADVKFMYFNTEEEMSEVYEKLQGQINGSTADDRLKSLEPRCPQLKIISEACNFVTYNRVTYNSNRNVINMSTVLQCWFDSIPETPHRTKTGQTTYTTLARKLTEEDARVVVGFLLLCKARWALDERALWKSINLTLCLWLYRRLVLVNPQVLTQNQFGVGLIGVKDEDLLLLIPYKKMDREGDRREVFNTFMKLFKRQLVAVKVKFSASRIPKPNWAKKV